MVRHLGNDSKSLVTEYAAFLQDSHPEVDTVACIARPVLYFNGLCDMVHLTSPQKLNL